MAYQGVAPSNEAFLGALMENEFQTAVLQFIRDWRNTAKQKAPPTRRGRRRGRRRR